MQVPQVTEEIAIAVLDLYPTLVPMPTLFLWVWFFFFRGGVKIYRSKSISAIWKSVIKGFGHQIKTWFDSFSHILLTLASIICMFSTRRRALVHKRRCLEGRVKICSIQLLVGIYFTLFGAAEFCGFPRTKQEFLVPKACWWKQKHSASLVAVDLHISTINEMAVCVSTMEKLLWRTKGLLQ